MITIKSLFTLTLALSSLVNINAYVCIENIGLDVDILNLISHYGTIDENDYGLNLGFSGHSDLLLYSYYDENIGVTLEQRYSVIVKLTSSSAEDALTAEQSGDKYADNNPCKTYAGGLNGYSVPASGSSTCTSLIASIAVPSRNITSYDEGSWNVKCATGNIYSLMGINGPPSVNTATYGITQMSLNCPFGIPGQGRCVCPGPTEYQTEDEPLHCKTCQGNTQVYYTQDGYGYCVACQSGFIAVDNHAACEPCPEGTYQSGSECVSCAARTYAPNPGSTVCTECPSGSISAENHASCEPCPAGTYQSGSECVPCDAGTYGFNPGSTSCTSCGAGFISYDDHTSCEQCPENTYSDLSTNTCKPCSSPANHPQVTSSAGSIDVSQCILNSNYVNRDSNVYFQDSTNGNIARKNPDGTYTMFDVSGKGFANDGNTKFDAVTLDYYSFYADYGWSQQWIHTNWATFYHYAYFYTNENNLKFTVPTCLGNFALPNVYSDGSWRRAQNSDLCSWYGWCC